uniref:Uncharacterized protein n=1 Tax=Pristionchus pacificus TaxID=54126 RepID=A0A2A6CAH5_PRIPA|eukprot:PDM75139.1 hypothetical protein PRIPAC_40520 [Pristionchus pacificus]
MFFSPFIHFNITFQSSAMNTSLLVYIINCVALIISVAQLCVASSIFDFIVVNKMYYTSHDETILIDPHHAIIFFVSPLLSAAIALLTIAIPNMPRSFQGFISRHPFLVALLHATLLGVSSIAFAFCSVTSAQLSLTIGYYAYNGVPQKFQDASFWYFIRLRASTVLFGLQSIFTLSQIGLLYMGIECRYKVSEIHFPDVGVIYLDSVAVIGGEEGTQWQCDKRQNATYSYFDEYLSDMDVYDPNTWEEMNANNAPKFELHMNRVPGAADAVEIFERSPIHLKLFEEFAVKKWKDYQRVSPFPRVIFNRIM